MNTEKIYLFIKILAVFGIGLAVYLLWQQFFQPTFNPCNINATLNCDAIINGLVAKTFGIPTPLIGLTGYIVILISAILGKKKLLLGMATFGLIFCLWIAYQELFLLKVICPVCIGCQTIMIITFILALILVRRKEGLPEKSNAR